MRNSILLAFLFFPIMVFSQNGIEVIVKDSITHELLSGVNVIVKGTILGVVTNEQGRAQLSNIPMGKQQLTFSFIGYQKKEVEYVFPLKNNLQLTITLFPEAEEIEEVTVSATRTNSRIEDLPTKIEVMGLEDMQEENTIRPANITSLLGDIAGIQLQQTSASSGNLNARIQGLNGRYSQVLRDGMPLYGGFSGSFSILQVPPIDLRQIEIIKGSASTLFGGDAIGGIINLVSKTPSVKPETNFLINQTSLNETDFNTYISRKYKKAGFTFFAGSVLQKAVDVNKDGFSDVPELKNLMFHPKLFLYLDKNTTLSVGLNSTIERRSGGDMQSIRHNISEQHPYLVSHKSFRNTVDILLDKKMENNSQLLFKGSTSLLDRTIETPVYNFEAFQQLFFTELSYLLKKENYDFVFGLNFSGDNFSRKKADSISVANYNYTTLGLFAQNDWHLTEKLLLESGLRYDYHSAFGDFLLPHLSVMYKFSKELTARINGGLGYKTPVIFSYIDEETDLNHIVTRASELQPETSQGVNFDINFFKHLAEELSLTLNQSFFFTELNHPVVYTNIDEKTVILKNADKPVQTKGFQTYLRISYNDLELYLSYVYTHAEKKYDPEHPWFLATPQHNLSGTLMYEFEKWRFGIENMLIGSQTVENDEKTPVYDFMAAMIERRFKKVSVVLNCENLFDYRQKNFLVPPVTNPSFKTLWAPIDGRVVNLSVNIRL